MNDVMESPVSHAGNKATGADTLSAVLPRQLESTCAFGSMIVCEPDRLKRVGCHGPVIAWLSPGDETRSGSRSSTCWMAFAGAMPVATKQAPASGKWK
jgi:hypothetical protein